MIQAVSEDPPPDSIDRFGSRDPYQPVTRRLRGRYSAEFPSGFGRRLRRPAQRPASERRALARVVGNLSRPPNEFARP